MRASSRYVDDQASDDRTYLHSSTETNDLTWCVFIVTAVLAPITVSRVHDIDFLRYIITFAYRLI